MSPYTNILEETGMRKIGYDEVLYWGEYDRIRRDERKKIIEVKNRRRVELGPYVSLHFENRTTVLYQIHEMMWIERIAASDRVRHEVDTYNDLIPAANELSATLFVEGADNAGAIREILSRLGGVQEYIYFSIGDKYSIQAEPERPEGGRERMYAIHYLKFRLTREEVAAFGLIRPLAISSEHPDYADRNELSEDTIRELESDLASS